MQPCPNPFLFINNTADGKSSWAECTEGLNLLHLSWLGINYARSANHTHPTEKQDSRRDTRVPTGQEFLELRCPLGRHPVPLERARPLRTAHLRNRGAGKFAGAAAGCRRPASPGTSCPPSPPRAGHSWPRVPVSPQPPASASVRILP